MRWSMSAGLVILFTFLTGCDRRGELLTVMPDGGAWHLFMLDSEEVLNSPDALPSASQGWFVFTDKPSEDESGDDTDESFWGLKRFSANEPYASSFAEPGTMDYDVSLEFPTTVEIEETREGTYFHFRRLYPSRDFAFADYYQSLLKENDEVEKLLQKDPATLTQDERKRMASILLEYEAERTAAFLDKAYSSLDTSLPQLTWLTARNEALSVYAQEDINRKVVKLMENVKESGDDIQSLTKQFYDQAVQTCITNMQQQKVAGFYRQTLQQAFDRTRQSFRITDALGSTSFEFHLELPGTIIASNATIQCEKIESVEDSIWGDFEEKDNQDADTKALVERMQKCKAEYSRVLKGVKYSKIEWHFDGKAIQDRSVELMATSFVPAEGK